MKFSMAILVYLLMALVLVYGVVLAAHGKPWLLVISALLYILAFVRIGCLPGKSH
jgi:hypothetical protein